MGQTTDTEPCEECGATMTWVEELQSWKHENTAAARECYTAHRWGIQEEAPNPNKHIEWMERRTLATYERLREKYLTMGLSYEQFRTYSRLCRRYNRKVGA